MYPPRRAFLIAAVVLAGCGTPSATPPERTGSTLMADTLAALVAQALARPMDNPFLSRPRADALERSLAGQTGADAINTRYLLAQERLQAGQFREAIAAIERLMADAGIDANSLTAETKPLFDLLAIAWLRLGEQENCAANPAATVCILPLAGSARHTREEGSRRAISELERILRRFPDDHGSRWLLNIGWMTLGGYPSRVPRAWRIPGLAPGGSGFPGFPNVAPELGVARFGMAGGLSIEDFNGDGFLDIFTTAWGLSDSIRYFEADGRGGYEDRSATAGLDGIVGGLNTVHADYDNDGDVDVLVLRGAWMGEAGRFPNSLLRNRGDGTFEDVTFAAGLGSFHPTQVGAWADFDRDGWLDLFVGNESQARTTWKSHRSELYRNNRDGTFREVSRQVGLDLDDFVKGAVWGDIDNDGLPDLYVSVLSGPNRLFHNRGGAGLDTWRFEEIAGRAGVTEPISSFPTWFWDYDQDGWDDILVLSYDLRLGNVLHDAVAREYLGVEPAYPVDGGTAAVEHSRLFRNNGDGTFADVTRAVGLDNRVIYAMGSNFGDLDNDGWLDFHVGTGNPDLRAIIPNRMFRNVAGQRFEEVTIPGGFGHLQKGHATAFADLDRDGDQDIYMVIGGAYEGDRFASALFENPGWADRSWIALQLEGRTANRSAIGARVEVLGDERGGRSRVIRRTVGTGGSFGAGPLRLHIGLGSIARIHQVRVRWPDSTATVTEYRGLDPNRAYRIVQGAAPLSIDHRPVPFRKATPIHERH